MREKSQGVDSRRCSQLGKSLLDHLREREKDEMACELVAFCLGGEQELWPDADVYAQGCEEGEWGAALASMVELGSVAPGSQLRVGEERNWYLSLLTNFHVYSLVLLLW